MNTAGHRTCWYCSKVTREYAKVYINGGEFRVICTPCYENGVRFTPSGAAEQIGYHAQMAEEMAAINEAARIKRLRRKP